MTRSTDEFKIHVAIVEHLRSAFPFVKVIHIPNQNRDAQEVYFNKMLGMDTGASDLMIAWKGGVGFLEIKSLDGKLSNFQNRFLSVMDSYGHQTGVAKSVKQAHNILVGWGHTPLYNSTSEPDLRDKCQKQIDSMTEFYGPPSEKVKSVLQRGKQLLES